MKNITYLGFSDRCVSSSGLYPPGPLGLYYNPRFDWNIKTALGLNFSLRRRKILGVSSVSHVGK